MIEMLDMGTAGVIGIRVSGKVEQSDIDRVIAAARARFDEAETIRAYVEMENFNGISLAALLEHIKFALPNLARLKKKAVVSDTKWTETTVAIGDRLFPNAEIRHFPSNQVAEARTWVSS